MMDGRESTQKVGSAPVIRRKESESEETYDWDQEVKATNTQKNKMNMKQEGPFLGKIYFILDRDLVVSY